MVEQVAPVPIDPEALADVRAISLPEGTLLTVTEMLRALADPTRVRILNALSIRPLCVRDLALVAKVSESAVSHQLRRLRDQRLVKSERKGNVIYYALDDHHLITLFREAERYALQHNAVPAVVEA